MQEFVSFYVKGSEDEPYKLVFTKTGDKNLSCDCTCQAGSMGISCKHRMRILCNNSEAIVDLNMDDFNKVQKWVTGSDVEEVINEIKQAEKELAKAKSKLSAAKKKLNKVLED